MSLSLTSLMGERAFHCNVFTEIDRVKRQLHSAYAMVTEMPSGVMISIIENNK